METEIMEIDLNIIISLVIMTYVAFNFYFMLEKFKIKD